MNSTNRSNEKEQGTNSSAPDNNPSKGTRLPAILDTGRPHRVSPIKGLLPVGLTVVAGSKNSYKSTLMRQIALHVSLGTDLLNTFKTDKGSVLYFALEEGKQDIQILFEKLLENRNLDRETDPEIIIITGEDYEKRREQGKSRIKFA